MNFNLAEQLAVLKALDEVICADQKIFEGEAIFVKQIASVMHFDLNLVPEAREIDAKEALAILKNMPINKKRALGVMLREAASADGRVDDRELRLIDGIFEEVGIDFDFI
jgi:uncharacterized tellurite resistance protein B-like protein